MTEPGAGLLAIEAAPVKDRGRGVVISALGVTQILAWGSSYYLLAVLAKPIASDTGWSLAWIVGGMSLGLIIASVISPAVGATIERRGGRAVLASSSALLALGLSLLSLAHSLPLFMAAWLAMGLGMGAGLYDAAFATLGRLYGAGARSAITTLTLWGGFASTVCWPLSAFLVEQLGWRGACLSYAAIQLFLALPLHLVLLPRAPPQGGGSTSVGAVEELVPPLHPREHYRAYTLLVAIATLAALTASLLSVHLLTILQDRGLELAGAVALGALVGPSQVGSRIVEMMFGRHYHPLWTMLTANLLIASGIALLLVGFPIIAIALVLYGAGNGIGSIARGTVPLALFGPSGYASLMGRLARPSLVAQAAAPSIGALLLQIGGAPLALEVLAAFSGANVALAIFLWATYRSRASV